MATPLKALIVISNLCHGGAERQVVELANRTNHSENIDLHICIFSTYKPLASLLENPEKLHIIEKKSKYDISIIFKLARLLKTHQFDLVHGFLFDAEIATRISGFLAGTTAVVGSERNSQNNFGRLKTFIYRLTSPLMHLCIANSSAGSEFSHRAFGIPRDKYLVIHNGVDIDRFRPGLNPPTRDSLGIPLGVKIVGMVGSFKRQKNHPLLLQALSQLTDNNFDFRLLLVGSKIKEGSEPTDEYYHHVQTTIDQLNLREKCVLIQARNDIENIYNLCDITVLPSLFEGTPNVALESMACGVPVIATNVADNQMVIPHGKVGYITNLGNATELSQAIFKLLSDDKLRLEISKNAREWAKSEFGLDKMASKFEEAYLKIVKARRQ